MSRYIKKHRRHIAGFAVPVFLVIMLAAVGLNIAPGWIQPTYGAPGDSCDSTTPCDACNGEFCSFISTICANYQGGIINTNPNIPDLQCPNLNTLFTIFVPQPPGCYNNCSQTFDTSMGQNLPVCLPDDQVCEDMSGGNEMNDCREGICIPNTTFDNANPSGCDYALDGIGTPPCVNCEPPVPADFDNCGNGVCEKDNGETFDNCSIDCRVPGFTGSKLNPGDPALDLPCSVNIVFPVPPQPPLSGICEDGDICTDNQCAAVAAVCLVTDKVCDDTQEDLCCPSGCNPPDDTGSCAGINNCDLDCIAPEVCPQPTPTPTPTPPDDDNLEGSGTLFSCSLQTVGTMMEQLQGLLVLFSLFAALGALKVLRPRKS